MNIRNTLGRFAAEAARAVAANKHEFAGDGRIYIPGARAFIGGAFRHAHAPAGEDFGPWAIDANRLVNEGLNYILGAALGGQAATSAYYLAPFSGNVTPAASWTAANFTANATEFTGYTSGTRLPWTTPGVPSAQALGNTAALTDGTMTFAAGGPYNVYGAALISSSAKSSVTGKLIAATRFDAPRLNMTAGDKLALEYVISAQDESDVA